MFGAYGYAQGFYGQGPMGGVAPAPLTLTLAAPLAARWIASPRVTTYTATRATVWVPPVRRTTFTES